MMISGKSSFHLKSIPHSCLLKTNPPLLATRLTTTDSQIKNPKISPQGTFIAYESNHSGEWEVYIISRSGGVAQRLTYKGQSHLLGWSPKGHVYVTNLAQLGEGYRLYEVSLEGLDISQRSLGRIDYYSSSRHGEVLARKLNDLSRWKDYKGGLAGQIWTKQNKHSTFTRILTSLRHSIGYVVSVGGDIYYTTDQHGCGNIYRTDFQGFTQKQLTFQKEFYVRTFSIQDDYLLYSAGGELYLQNLNQSQFHKLQIAIHSSFDQQQPRYIPSATNLQDMACSYQGAMLASLVRGSLYTMKPWIGGVKKLDQGELTQRFRQVKSFGDSTDFLAVGVNKQGEDRLLWCQGRKENQENDTPYSLRTLSDQNIGKIQNFKSTLDQKSVVITTFREELWLLSIKAQSTSLTLIDRSSGSFDGFDISADGSYIAYSKVKPDETLEIWLYQLSNKTKQPLMTSLACDIQPTFDPKEPLLYFFSTRTLVPILSDALSSYTFSANLAPYVVHLDASAPSLFDRTRELSEEDSSQDPQEEGQDDKTKKKKTTSKSESSTLTTSEKQSKKSHQEKQPPKKLQVDFEGCGSSHSKIAFCSRRLAENHRHRREDLFVKSLLLSYL